MNAADPTSSPPRPGPACPRCHRPIPADALGDACPSCLLAAGFFSQTTAPAADHEPTIPIEALTPEFPALELLEQLGRGGMGAVYKARQRDLDRLVALKILRPGLDADPTFAARFAEEARALARLNHPGIVTLHEFGRTSAGRYFIVMEFVDGMNLRQLLAAGRIAPREALAIVPPLCDALQYAHDRGLVHRDIKPENILLDRLGRVKIADFGLARLATSPAEPADKVMGTPAYMAPEQRVHAAAVDHRADIYALGVVLYQMLTGELPARGALQPPSRRVQIDVRLDEIVLRALEADPARRYSAAGELKTEIETLSAPPPPSASPARSSLRLRLGVGITVSAVAAFALWITPPRTNDGKPAPFERPPGPPSVVISVSVQGAVARPAMYSLRPDATLLDAIAAAGGWTSDGDTSAIILTVAGSDHPEVHGLGAILHGEAVNPGLGAGATVFVPTRDR